MPRTKLAAQRPLLAIVLLIPCLARGQQPFPTGTASARYLAPNFELEYLAPEVHKWYAPRNLVEEYARPWYRPDTRYARDIYTRYVNRLLEGAEFVDGLGNRIGRGWLVYSWTQDQPQPRGSNIVTWPRLAVTSREAAGIPQVAPYQFRNLFQKLVIATDTHGRGTYRLMVGDAISTTLTPLTFRKPRYNGLRLDYAGESFETTLLLSRPSQPEDLVPDRGVLVPGRSDNTNYTHLAAGHLQIAPVGLLNLGFTYVNARTGHTQLELNHGNPLAGALTVKQNRSLSKLWVRLRDDSPEDRSGGAALLAHDIVLADTSGRELIGSEIGFFPQIEGGATRAGVLVADGSDEITLAYDLASLDHEGVRTADIQAVGVRLTVANDYRIESASDLTADARRLPHKTVFLKERRAAGNVRDKSNAAVVEIDYGLPVANDIVGLNWALVDWEGLSFQGELAVNRQFERYPNPALKKHHQTVAHKPALYANAAYQRFPFTVFLEGFSIDDAYTTRHWLAKPEGEINYESPIPDLYEFVDDDDDQNGWPEWERPFSASVREAAPGYDENGDFLHDHNQNDNNIPDYEEPFLRFRADRPEFLFGLDMNHNGTVDRFENDLLPDYPYRRDHRGWNAYVRAAAGPDLAVTAGRQRMSLTAGDGRTHSWYALGSWQRPLQRGGKIRVFEHAALVRDDIPDDLVMWVQPVDREGHMREMADELRLRNAWKNTLNADADQRWAGGARAMHRVKWDMVRQREPNSTVVSREARRTSGFIGVVNKVEWGAAVGLGVIEPRWKSEYRWQRPYSARRPPSSSVEQTAILMWTQPLLGESVTVSYFPGYGRQLFKSEFQLGIERLWFWLLEGRRTESSEDYSRWTVLAQLTNRSAYEGYHLIARAGVRFSRWDLERSPDQKSSLLFMTVQVGLQ